MIVGHWYKRRANPVFWRQPSSFIPSCIMAAVDQQHSPADQHSVELEVLRSGHVQNDSPAPSEATPTQYPRGIRLVLITIGLILSIFTSALDTTIISTALPAITDDFGTINDIAWYGTSMVITHTAFQS